MHAQLVLQALLLTLASGSPLPQRTTDLSGLTGSLGGGSLGSGSGFNLTRLTSLFSGAGSGSGGSGFDLSKLGNIFGGGSGSGTGTGAGLPDFDLGSLLGGGAGVPGSLPSIPDLGSGSGTGGSLPSIPSLPSTGTPSTGGSTGGSLGGGFAGIGGNTANDVTSGQPCKSNILLFARGTTEGGNLGSTVGPSLQREIEKAAPGKFMFQGVSYQADIQGIVALGRPGGEIAKKLIEESVTKCPNARIFLSGYSQGAMVMHNAVTGTSAANKAKVGVSILLSQSS